MSPMTRFTITTIATLAFVLASVLTAGCGVTQMDLLQANQFNAEPNQAQQQSDCMSEQQLFAGRSAIVAPASIEGAWVYCTRYSDIWHPGKDSEKPSEGWQVE